ncbi:hypothetical protein [Phenylobacterium sp.]|uniref:hypothetical protein n=1 Tax=Phenylobacterium sp. TaxID=1871053 RepID=UPI00272F9472|nr:hypothetical protein [Phenylobacterium sp.]MDP1616183.1 hypothetical protein [Phenylobacterium sp.]MDP1988177.1 hypothetical protein [Phenylobacterium sp.]
MSAIRPPFPNALPAAPQGVTPQPRSAAQKAFFEAALGRAAPTQAPAPAQVPTKAAAPSASIQPHATAVREVPLQVRAGDEPPQKILRPGSLLDIRV